MSVTKRLLTGLAVFGLIGGVTAVVAPAESASAATGCVFPTGTTGAEGTNAHGLPEVGGGSTFTKPPTSSTTCHDFNLWKAAVKGVAYEGWLYYGNGNWGACNAGYVTYNGSPIVLCTDVLPGTLEAVTSTTVPSSGVSIQIED